MRLRAIRDAMREYRVNPVHLVWWPPLVPRELGGKAVSDVNVADYFFGRITGEEFIEREREMAR